MRSGVQAGALSLTGWEKMGETTQTSLLPRPAFLPEGPSRPQCQNVGAPSQTGWNPEYRTQGPASLFPPEPWPHQSCRDLRGGLKCAEAEQQERKPCNGRLEMTPPPGRSPTKPAPANCLRCPLCGPALPFSPSTVGSLGSSAVPPDGWPLGGRDCPCHLFFQYPAQNQAQGTTVE